MKTVRHLDLAILLGILLFTTPNLARITSSIPKNETILIGNHEQSLIKREAFEFNTTKYQQYNHTILWENSIVILNETMTFNASTHLIINNSAVEFTPVNASQIIKLTIGINSQLDIYNSNIYLGGDFEGYGSLIFSEGVVNVINSTFTQLGMNFPNNGFRVLNSQVTIIESIFESGFSGVYFENNENCKIINSHFRNLTSYGIFGRKSTGISITNSTFKNLQNEDDTAAIYLDNCQEICILKSRFNQIGNLGVKITYNVNYYDVYNVWIERNTFQDSEGSGISVAGKNVTIINNSFTELGHVGVIVEGRNILVESNIFIHLNGGIMTVWGLSTPDSWLLSSISNATFRYNTINQVHSFGILIQNHEFDTLFQIYKNNISNVLNFSALMFYGRLGGPSETNRSWVVGNIINNTAGYAVACNCAAFHHTSFVQNAFIGCQSEETWFRSDQYSKMTDIRFDNGFFGNYWEGALNEAVDEDYNQIDDNFYLVSSNYGLVDSAPLLSLDLLDKQASIGSIHPQDFVRLKSELKGEKNTLIWTILAMMDMNVSVWLDNKQIAFEQFDVNITVSLVSLDVGVHNFTLILQVEGQIYRDLVWVRILADEFDITDVIIPFGILVFIALIIVVVVTGIWKRK